MTAETKLVVMRRIAGAPQRVFEACTDPGLLAQWLGPAAFVMTHVEADVRIGGRFAFRMTGDAGTFAAEGRYEEIVPGQRIVLTWKWTEGSADQPPDGMTSLVTFEIQPAGQGTLLTLTHERLPDAKQTNDHRTGWTESLDKLERLFAASPGSA